MQLNKIPRTVSNREFFAKFAHPGMVGLAGGETLLDHVIARAQRHIDADKKWGQWSHAFIIGEKRCDGNLWVIESDLDVHRKLIRFGAQENPVSKFDDGSFYSSMALLDFGLDQQTVTKVIAGGLELIAGRTRYSLRELIGTLIALRHPKMRAVKNPLDQPESFYCSALVRCLFLKAGVDIAPGLDIKNTTPEDIWRSPLVREAWTIDETAPKKRVAGAVKKVMAKFHRSSV